MKFEMYRNAITGAWRWRLKAANGEKIASGESYARKIDCVAAITLVRSTGDKRTQIEIVAK